MKYVAARKADSSLMRTFWKVLSVALFASCMVFHLISFSMYWWPNIPSSPQPAEGRIYPLNNHGHYTYMNRSEYLLEQIPFWIYPLFLAAFAAIQYFADPFDELRRRRLYRWPPQS
jgi:hypothetical protein